MVILGKLILVGAIACNCLVSWGEPLVESYFAKDQSSYLAQWDGLEEKLKNGEITKENDGLLVHAFKDNADSYVGLSPKNIILPASYTIEIKAVPLAWHKEDRDSHFGVDVDGLKVVVWPTRMVVENAASVNYVRAGRTSYESPLNQEVCLTVQNRPDRIEVMANGKLIATAVKKTPFKAGLGLWIYNANLRLESVSIDAGLKNSVSPNLLRNSGFETATNPAAADYWGTFLWGFSRLGGWRDKMDEFRTCWGPESSTMFEGKRAFRIKAKGHDEGLSLYSNWIPGLSQIGRDYTFSVYVKSDVKDLPFSLGVVNNVNPVNYKAGTEWQRHELTFKLTAANGQPFIRPEGAGTLWVDAAQLELGAKATAYSKCQAELDDDKARPPAPSSTLTLAGRPPTLDGVLDDPAWVKLGELKTIEARTPHEKTIVYACYDDTNLYLAAECFDHDIKRIKADVKNNGGLVCADDCVEIFIKPNDGGNGYFQYAVNSANAKYAAKTMAEELLGGGWRTATKLYQDRWILEAAIPIAELDFQGDKDVLTFNFCRTLPRSSEACSWSPSPRGGYHNFKNWGRIYLKAIGNALKIDRLDLTQQAGSEKCGLSLRLSNPSAQPLTCDLVLTIPNGRASFKGCASATVPPHERAQISFNDIPAALGEKTIFIVTAKSGERTLLYQRFEAVASPAIRILPEYSYFSNESEVRFKAIPGIAACRLNYILRQADGKKLDSGRLNFSGLEPGIITLPKKPDAGSYRIDASLIGPSGAVVGNASEPFTVTGHKQNESKINYWRRSIYHNGEEFFSWALTLEGRLDEPLAKMLKNQGFNMVESALYLMRDEFNDLPKVSASIEKDLAICEKYGLKNVPHLGVYTPGLGDGRDVSLRQLVRIKPLLEKYQRIIPFLAYIDEAYGAKVASSQLDEWATLLRGNFGNGWLLRHNEDAAGILFDYNMKNGDIVSLDHYPIPDGDIASTYKYLKKLKRNADPKQVLHVYLQSCGNAYFIGREPTVDELYNQVYSAFALDCWNICFFANVPLNAHVFQTLQKIRAERDVLIALNAAAGAESNMDVSESDDIKYLAKELDGCQLVIAVNLCREPRKGVRFSSMPGSGNLEVLFEGRYIPVKNGSFTDDFKPLERHVYKMPRQITGKLK